MRTSNSPKGLTIVEVLITIFVAIVVVLLLAAVGIAFTSTAVKPAEPKVLSDARQIGLACKSYAIDHNGQFPTFIAISGTTTSTRIVDYSNTAFDQLFPLYLSTNRIFHVFNSAWTPTVLPEPTQVQMEAGKSLPAGSNEWAYVTGLYDDSNATLPLIADGFANLKTHAYTTDPSAFGGVWKGREAVVVFCDDSAAVIRCDPSTHKIPGSPNGADLFDTSGQQGWLTSTGTNPQTVLNPVPPTIPTPPQSRKAWFSW